MSAPTSPKPTMPPSAALPPVPQGWAATPAEDASAKALIQIQAHLNAVRNMMVFFVVLTVLGLILGGFAVASVH